MGHLAVVLSLAFTHVRLKTMNPNKSNQSSNIINDIYTSVLNMWADHARGVPLRRLLFLSATDLVTNHGIVNTALLIITVHAGRYFHLFATPYSSRTCPLRPRLFRRSISCGRDLGLLWTSLPLFAR